MNLISPEQFRFEERLSQLPRLSLYAGGTGVCYWCGQDFLRPRDMVPIGEEGIYVDYLPDRRIGRYSLPRRTSEVVFFPFEGDQAATEADIRSDFPETWRYLQLNEMSFARDDRLKTKVNSGGGECALEVRLLFCDRRSSVLI